MLPRVKNNNNKHLVSNIKRYIKRADKLKVVSHVSRGPFEPKKAQQPSRCSDKWLVCLENNLAMTYEREEKRSFHLRLESIVYYTAIVL